MIAHRDSSLLFLRTRAEKKHMFMHIQSISCHSQIVKSDKLHNNGTASPTITLLVMKMRALC